MSELASSELLDRELYLKTPVREPHRYPRQKNIQGLYYFEGTGHHVWHESLLEASVMRWLDMSSDVVAISAQPMLIRFADGTEHTPDILALHSDHQQVLYDVKPRKFIPAFEEQFAKTKALCEVIGFGYEVRHELPRQVDINLSWISGFKHPGYYPGDAVAYRFITALEGSTSLRRATGLIGLPSAAQGRSALFHLIWAGLLTLDLTIPISDSSLIRRNHS